MDPNTQLALNDMFRRFTVELQHSIGDLDSRLERRFDDIETQQNTRVQTLENSLMAATMEFESLWFDLLLPASSIHLCQLPHPHLSE